MEYPDYVFDTGTYCICVNDIRLGVYIGETCDSFIERFYHNYNSLLNKKHHNKLLQEHFNNYSADTLKFYIIEKNLTNLKQESVLKEYSWIRIFKSYGIPVFNKQINPPKTRKNKDKDHILFNIYKIYNLVSQKKVFYKTQNLFSEDSLNTFLSNTKNEKIINDLNKFRKNSFKSIFLEKGLKYKEATKKFLEIKQELNDKDYIFSGLYSKPLDVGLFTKDLLIY